MTEPAYKFITGPVSLTEHIIPKLKKHIYIFGDVHFTGDEIKCVPPEVKEKIYISDFLDRLLKYHQGKKIIDVFLEYELIYRKRHPKRTHHFIQIKKTSSGLEHTIILLKKCLEISKIQCNYPNVRAHYADVRPVIGSFKVYYNILYGISENQYGGSTVSPILREIVDLFQRDLSNLFKISKIKDQYEHIKDNTIRTTLENTFLLQLEYNKLTMKEIHQLRSLADYYDGKSDEIDIENIALDEIAWKCVNFGQAFIDMYLVGRMFRNFQDGEDPNYIIIYTGEKHASVYRKILSDLGANEIQKTTSFDSQEEILDLYGEVAKTESFQCIDISKFQQPFFTLSTA